MVFLVIVNGVLMLLDFFMFIGFDVFVFMIV